MKEPTQGLLVTVPAEALHTELTHTSFIFWYKKTLKLVDWLTPPSIPPTLSHPLSPLFAQIPMETGEEENETKWAGEIVRERER